MGEEEGVLKLPTPFFCEPLTALKNKIDLF